MSKFNSVRSSSQLRANRGKNHGSYLQKSSGSSWTTHISVALIRPKWASLTHIVLLSQSFTSSSRAKTWTHINSWGKQQAGSLHSEINGRYFCLSWSGHYSYSYALEWGGLKKQHSLAAIYNLPTYVGEIINTNFNLTEVRGKKKE